MGEIGVNLRNQLIREYLNPLTQEFGEVSYMAGLEKRQSHAPLQGYFASENLVMATIDFTNTFSVCQVAEWTSEAVAFTRGGLCV